MPSPATAQSSDKQRRVPNPKGILNHIKNAHHPFKTRQIGGAKRAQPRVDSSSIKYPYTLIISHDLGSVPPLMLQVAQ